MNTPKVSILFSNGNLLAKIVGEKIGALIGTGQQAANKGKVFIVNNLAEAEAQGITIFTEPYAYRQVKEFYQELAADKELYILLVADTVDMAAMLDSTATDKANLLLDAGAGKIAYLGVFKTPPAGYNAGVDYMDADVSAAVLAAKSFVQAQNAKLRFLRVLIEGRVNNETSNVIYAPNTAANGFAGVVAGGTLNDGSASVGLALGRKLKFPSHIKIGKVANGPLSVSDVYIGTKKLNAQNNLVIPAVAEVRPTATATITNMGADGDDISIYVPTKSGWLLLGSYKKVAGDNTPTLVATALRNAINTNSYGYTAISAAALITITAPLGTGDVLNGTQLQVNIHGTIAATKTAFTGGVPAANAQSFSAYTLHEKGYISFLTYPNKAGFYFGIDNMASNDDYAIMVHGAVIDEVANIAAAVYLEQLEGNVKVDAMGKIEKINLEHLKGVLSNQVNQAMSEKISGIEISIDPNQDIINTSKLAIKVRVRPMGYTTFIEIDLGFKTV